MELVTLEQVRAHCRAEGEDDAVLEQFADAAERAASEFLNRRIFPDESAKDDALDALPAAVSAAEDAYAAACEAAQALSGEVRCISLRMAEAARAAALREARDTAAGIVVNPAIVSAVLLTAGHLYRNREATTAEPVRVLPLGVHELLWPFRVGLGV